MEAGRQAGRQVGRQVSSPVRADEVKRWLVNGGQGSVPMHWVLGI